MRAAERRSRPRLRRRGVAEAMEIARRTGVRLHFAHYRTQPETAGRIDAIMEPIDAARTRGGDVTFDIYPYPRAARSRCAICRAAPRRAARPILRRLADPGERVGIAHDRRDEERRFEQLVCSYCRPRRSWRARAWRPGRAAGRSMGEVLCELLSSRASRSATSRRRRGASPSGGSSAGTSWSCSPARTTWSAATSPRGRLPSSPLLRRLSALPRPSPPGVRDPHPGGDGPPDDRPSRPALRPHAAAAASSRATSPTSPCSIGDRQRHRHLRDPRQFPIGIPFVIVNGAVAVDDQRCTGVFAGQAVP